MFAALVAVSLGSAHAAPGPEGFGVGIGEGAGTPSAGLDWALEPP